jgi:hypothetical protein
MTQFQSEIAEILVEMDAAVAIVTINRPAKLNSVTQEMSAVLEAFAAWANDSDEVRAIVLTGAGERSFSCGSDIRTLDRYGTPWEFRNRRDYCDALRDIRKPVIAAINGVCARWRARNGADLRHPDRLRECHVRRPGDQVGMGRRWRRQRTPCPLDRSEQRRDHDDDGRFD